MNYHFEHWAGDTLDFPIKVPDYPSTDGWTLKYRLSPRFSAPAQLPFVIQGSGNADGSYQLQASPSTTAGWAPGAYSWERWVEKTSPAVARQTLASSKQQGEVLILPDPATSTQPRDLRSHAKKMLEQIESALEALNAGTKSYTIGIRSWTATDKPELTGLHDRYLRLAGDEDAAAAVAAGQQNPRKVVIRFGDIR